MEPLYLAFKFYPRYTQEERTKDPNRTRGNIIYIIEQLSTGENVSAFNIKDLARDSIAFKRFLDITPKNTTTHAQSTLIPERRRVEEQLTPEEMQEFEEYYREFLPRRKANGLA